ncbi:MAG: RNHCP domain-containing protein [bacterium]|nr:RNHCP domain-containing protein [bacterium]
MNKDGFICLNCKKYVQEKGHIGTAHRNHCPFCLWSKHVDKDTPGDRRSLCQGKMEPIGLTFKKELPDKYGKGDEKGELMIIHKCLLDGKISINRVAGDDDPLKILDLLERAKEIDGETSERLAKSDIKLADENDVGEIKTQLYGRK